jgi:hypothetical protein
MFLRDTPTKNFNDVEYIKIYLHSLKGLDWINITLMILLN